MSALTAAVYGTVQASQFARMLENDAEPPALSVAAVHELLPGAVFGEPGFADGTPADVALVVTTPETTLPSIAAMLAGSACEGAALEREVDAFAAAVADLPARIVLATTWIAQPRFAGGLLALDPRYGLDAAVAAANARLVHASAQHPALRLLNAAHWQHTLGARAFNDKGWYLTKDPFSFELWRLAVGDAKAAVAALTGRAKKLLVLDLDNTLWGGEVGDVGLEGLQLGGHDASGEAFAAFQRDLLALYRRGVVLAIASKNDESVALAAIDAHPEMVLRRDHFAGWAIDWEDKGPNVRALCERIGISPADAVFIDDNPAERQAVARALPEMLVPEWPTNPMLYSAALRKLSVFDVPDVTDEDLARAGTYVARRAAFERAADSPLEVRIDIRPLADVDAPRALQLLNKTNQMNLTTRRLTENELRAWLAAGDRAMWTVRVADAFADYGITGLFSLAFERDACTIEDFLMSCRVMSRGVEARMLDAAAEAARARGARRLDATFVRTERNEPMRKFLFERSGLHSDGKAEFSLELDGLEVRA